MKQQTENLEDTSRFFLNGGGGVTAVAAAVQVAAVVAVRLHYTRARII